MGLVKKKGSRFWWVDITVPVKLVPIHGPRIRRSTEIEATKEFRAQAQEWHDKIKNDLWRQDKLDEAPKYTLKQAVERWEVHAAEKGLRTADETKRKLAWWMEQLGANTPLVELTRQRIQSKVEGKKTLYDDREVRQAKPATINRYLQAMRGLLRLCAREWEMLETPPLLKLRQEPKGRVRVLQPDQARTLLDQLPEHWRPIFIFALATGLRQANVVRLRWDQVDLARRRLLVGSEEFKNGEDFGIPLNETAMAVLRDRTGTHPTAVFSYEGEPLQALKSATWKKALAKAGVSDFRWHDLRHTWATMFVEGGGDLDELQKLGGWKDRTMVLRYAHYRTDHLRGAASVVDKGLGGLLKPDPLPPPSSTARSGHSEGS